MAPKNQANKGEGAKKNGGVDKDKLAVQTNQGGKIKKKRTVKVKIAPAKKSGVGERKGARKEIQGPLSVHKNIKYSALVQNNRDSVNEDDEGTPLPAPVVKRGRGRPKGSGLGVRRKKISLGSSNDNSPAKSRVRKAASLIPKTGDEEMNLFLSVSAAYIDEVGGLDKQSDSETDVEDDDDELFDPDDDVMESEKKKVAVKTKGKRGRKKKILPPISPPRSTALCVYPMRNNEVAVIGRRALKREFLSELDSENQKAICTLFKKRKTLKVGTEKDPDSILTNKLISIQTSPWFDKKVKSPLILGADDKMRPLLLPPRSNKLMQIMWLYHTNWIINKTAEQRPGIINDPNPDILVSPNSLGTFGIDWIKRFLVYFWQYCQDIMSSNSNATQRVPYELKTILNMCLAVIVDVSAKELTKLSMAHFHASKSVNKWSDTINTAIQKKDSLLEDLELLLFKMMTFDSNLDEGSIWGLKPIRKSLAPPYFKTADGLAAAPRAPLPLYNDQRCEDAFYNFNKQKWTIKDIDALRISVREALIEKRLLQIQMRADVLLQECKLASEEKLKHYKLLKEMGEMPEPEPGARRCGRPRKAGKSAHLATIAPQIFGIQTPQGVISVRALVTNNHIEDWRDLEITKVNKLQLNDLLELNYCIEWESVSSKVGIKTKKNRSATDCLLAFQCDGDPRVHSTRWNHAEAQKLKDEVNRQENLISKKRAKGIDWGLVVKKITAGRTGYQCFFRWRNMIAKPPKIKWRENKDTESKLQEMVLQSDGNWKKVVGLFGNELATKKLIIDRYKKNSNPNLRSGPFSRAEDALLLVAIEKLKGHLKLEGHFGELIAHLPWRFETVWRDRAGNLFADWIMPWTIQEDKMLLELAESKKGNWRAIADTFDTFKNRKGCLTRWKILKKRFASFATIEEYHEAYSMIRYNIFQYQHLQKVLALLKKVYRQPVYEFHGFDIGHPPSEETIQDFLLSCNRQIIWSTMKSLNDYIMARDQFWKNELQVPTEKKRTFDRRTFNGKNPQSVASALHIRKIELKPKSTLTIKLKEFEKDIYKFYARFKRTKPLKDRAKRPYLPSKRDLVKLKSVKRIIIVK